MVTAGSKRFEAANVVVAMANYQRPRLPGFAEALNPRILQLHSHVYRNSDQLKKGNVLIVGVGNSGADIAIEVAGTHPLGCPVRKAATYHTELRASSGDTLESE